jgi:hypothetical protein
MTAAIWLPGGTAEVLSSKIIREIALSDLTSALVASPNVGYFRVYAPFFVSAIRISLLVASTAGIVTVDMNKNGATLLSTKLTIDVNEFDNTTAAVPYVANTTLTFAVGDVITFDLDVIGTTAKGLMAYLIGNDL